MLHSVKEVILYKVVNDATVDYMFHNHARYACDRYMSGIRCVVWITCFKIENSLQNFPSWRIKQLSWDAWNSLEKNTDMKSFAIFKKLTFTSSVPGAEWERRLSMTVAIPAGEYSKAFIGYRGGLEIKGKRKLSSVKTGLKYSLRAYAESLKLRGVPLTSRSCGMRRFYLERLSSKCF